MKKSARIVGVSKYLLCLVLFYLLSMAKPVDGTFGVAISLYATLVTCELNVWALSPTYIAGCMLADPTLAGIVYAISPVVVMIVGHLISKKLKKKIGLLACNICAFVALVPMIIVDAYRLNPFAPIVALVVTQTVTYFVADFLRAYLLRGSSHKFSINESVGGVVLAVMLSWGLATLNLWGFRPYYAVMGLALGYAVSKTNPVGAVTCGFAVAMGGALSGQGLELVGSVLAVVLVGEIFVRYNKWLACASMIMVFVATKIYFNYYGDMEYLALIGFGVGMGMWTVLPTKLTDRLPDYKRDDASESAKNMLVQARCDLAERMGQISSVFFCMADAYCKFSATLPDPDKAEVVIATELMNTTCKNCTKREECVKALGKEPSAMFQGLVASCLSTGKASLVDLPNFINSRCIKIPQLLSGCNYLAGSYLSRLKAKESYSKDQQLMATQLAGVGSALSEIGEELKDVRCMDGVTEKTLIEELGYQNIICTQALAVGGKNGVGWSLVVRKEDVDNPRLIDVASKVAGNKLTVVGEVNYTENNKAHVNLAPQSKYELSYGYCGQVKENSGASGDIVKVLKIRNNKALIALCDGMGSGKDAQTASARAIDMVGGYYQAGFDNPRALTLINKLLAVTSEDNFCALDMCVVDLDSGVSDFIKLGGVESYIRRDVGVQVISAAALPLGIVEEATPKIDRQMLAVGDMAVLVSDGISDALGVAGLKLILDKIGSLNPQTVCNEVLAQAKNIGLKDDASVVAFRLFVA